MLPYKTPRYCGCCPIRHLDTVDGARCMWVCWAEVIPSSAEVEIDDDPALSVALFFSLTLSTRCCSGCVCSTPWYRNAASSGRWVGTSPMSLTSQISASACGRCWYADSNLFHPLLNSLFKCVTANIFSQIRP